MPKKIALIPARSGSKRVPDKNITLINGKPLIHYTLELCAGLKLFDEIIISTDSEHYADIAKQIDDVSVDIRPVEFAQDGSPDIDWVRDIVHRRGFGDDDALFILRPTSPLRDKDFILSGWQNFSKAGHHYDSLRAVAEVDQHPAKMWSIIDGDLMPLYPFLSNDVPWHSNQSAILPKVYKQTASLEIVWGATIKQKNSLSGTRIMPHICSGHNAFDINSQDDLDYLKVLIAAS